MLFFWKESIISVWFQDSLSQCRGRCRQELEELRKYQTEKVQLLLQQNEEKEQNLKRENREKEQALKAENERALALLIQDNEAQEALMVAKHDEEERVARWFAKKTITSAELRTLKPYDAVFMAAWNADSHFYKMANQARLTAKVKSITVIQNSKLHAAFESKRKDFIAKGIPADFIYAYHGTKNDPTVMDSILKNNFDMKYAQRQVHGPGHYFSEFPDVSLAYGTGLIFCQLLSGKEYKGRDLSWPGFNSKVTHSVEDFLLQIFEGGEARCWNWSLSNGDHQRL